MVKNNAGVKKSVDQEVKANKDSTEETGALAKEEVMKQEKTEKKVEEKKVEEKKVVEASGLDRAELSKKLGTDVKIPDIFRGDPDRDPQKTRVEVADVLKVIDEKRFFIVEAKNQILIKNLKQKDTDKIRTQCWVSKNGSWTGFIQAPQASGDIDLIPYHKSEEYAIRKHLGRIRMVITGVERLDIVGIVIAEFFGNKKTAKK